MGKRAEGSGLHQVGVVMMVIGAAIGLIAAWGLGPGDAHLSDKDVQKLFGIVLALAGTGQFLAQKTNNAAAYWCGLAGWMIIAFG